MSLSRPAADPSPQPTPAPFGAREAALRRAARLRGLYIHCLAFVLGNAANLVVNAMTRRAGGNWWFQWALVAWTVALAVHAITVLGNGAWFGPAWEERKVRQYLRADRVTDDPPDVGVEAHPGASCARVAER